MTRIRTATDDDAGCLRSLHLSAFEGSEGGLVSKLAVDLLSETTTPPTLSWVAEADGAVVAHVAFSPAMAAGNKYFKGYILAPLGVRPDYQGSGIGSRLVESGIRRLRDMDVDMIFVYGDPGYYVRFGFRADAAEGYVPPYRLKYPFGWQGLVLRDEWMEQPPLEIYCVTSLRDPALW